MTRPEVATRSGGRTAIGPEDFRAFRDGLRGTALAPGDAGYEEARRVWNGMIDRRPGLIVRCAGAADVMDCVALARDHDLLFSVRSGGHNVAGHAVLDGGMVVDLSAMRAVRVDQARGTVRVEAGARLGDVDRETQAFGLAVPLGVVSKTGVAGLSLHGGVGWLMRRHGMTMDNIASVDIVTGDGRLRAASAETDPDLLWAVRGGGGNFGIVTSFEFACHPVGPMVRLAAPVHPAHRAGELLRLVRGAAESVPEDVALLTVLWTGPEAPAVPEPYRGQPVAILLACHTGPPADAEQALRPFAEFGPPVADLGGPMAYRSLQRLLDPEYPDGRRYYWKSVYVPELTDGIIEALVRSGAGRPSPLSSVDVWTLGGAIGRFGPEHGPFARRGDRFLVAFEANWDDPGQDQANIAWTRASFAEVQALSRGPSYLNFPGFAEEGEAMLRGFYGGNYGRLREIKARYDPDNLFRGSVNIAP